MTLYVCGCRGSDATSGRNYLEFGGDTTCYVLREGDYAVVIDCGTGLRNAGRILAGCGQVDVLLTHVHYDHIMGLLAPRVFPAEANVRFFSAFDAWGGADTLQRFFQPPFWPVAPVLGEMVTVHPPEQVLLRPGVTAEFRESFHPGGGALIKLRWGAKTLCFLWDYESGCDDLEQWVRGSDLVCYDGMFDDSEYASHVGWGHSSWQEGCRLARRSGISRLIITHHAPEHDDQWLLDAERRAQSLFADTHFARAGDEIQFGEVL